MKKYLLTGGLLLLLGACYKEVPDDTPNPFAGQNGNGNNNGTDTLSPTSIQGLHKQIFSVRCAMPLCHDGSFEPDFRTVESSYNNLVYHSVVKNNASNSFDYRVIPYDTDNSWLIERLTTTDVVLGRMPLYSDPLSETQLGHIKTWINEGCRDMSGNVAVYPNLQPQVYSRFAIDQNQVRLDTNYDGRFPAPFIIPPGTPTTLAVQVNDDSTAIDKLKNMVFKFSYDKDDFSAAVSKPGTYFSQDIIFVQFNANEFQAGKTVYFRFYCVDDHHTLPAEFPKFDTPFFYKDLFAFIVK